MISKLEKIINRELYFYISIFYLLLKYTCFNKGREITYFLFIYAVIIFIFDFIKNKSIYKFDGYIYSYLICGSAVLSCIVVAKSINVTAISGIAILFINFFMYLPMFYKKDIKYIIKKFEFIFVVIIIYSFIKNSIGLFLASKGIALSFFGVKYGALHGERLVTVRETANETGWFAIFSIVSSIYFLIKSFNNAKCNLFKLFNDKVNLFIIFNILIQIITFILSGNRSSFIGIIVSLFAIIYIYELRKQNKKLVLILRALFVVCSLLIFSYVYIKSLDSTGSEIARIDMIRFGIFYVFTVNPLLGSSYVKLWNDLDANFDIIWDKHTFNTPKEYLKQLTRDGNAHNVFIQQLETNGILGLVFLLVFFIYVAKQVFTFAKSMIKDGIYFVEKSYFIFFIIFGFVVGNISWTIVGTMTCFVNFLFFLSISAVLAINNEYIIEKV